MDRNIKKEDTVLVYQSTEMKWTGQAVARVKLTPYSRAGFDYYQYRGKLYAGYLDETPGADACIFLSCPVKVTAGGIYDLGA